MIQTSKSDLNIRLKYFLDIIQKRFSNAKLTLKQLEKLEDLSENSNRLEEKKNLFLRLEKELVLLISHKDSILNIFQRILSNGFISKDLIKTIEEIKNQFEYIQIVKNQLPSLIQLFEKEKKALEENEFDDFNSERAEEINLIKELVPKQRSFFSAFRRRSTNSLAHAIYLSLSILVNSFISGCTSYDKIETQQIVIEQKVLSEQKEEVIGIKILDLLYVFSF